MDPRAEELVRRFAAGDRGEVWGDGVPDVEGAARFLSVWLDESLATRTPRPDGWWSLVGPGFEPIPPWEAHAARRRA